MTEAGNLGRAAQTGGQLFFEAAQQYGLTHVFGNPGTTEVNFMDALSQAPHIQFFLCLHEDVATGAADGFARITGRPALVNLHLAPGLAHGLANLHNAKRARMPVIVTVGDHHTNFTLEEPPLAEDILGMARSICKWSYSVKVAEELPAALHRAMLQALTPPCGPVCLVLPNNVMSQPLAETINIPALHIPQPGPAHPAAIAQAVQFLQQARKPLIVVGDVVSEAGQNALLQIARYSGASIWRDFTPNRIDPTSDPLLAASHNKLPYFPRERRLVLQNADCIVLAGVSGFTNFFFYDDDQVRELVSPNVPVIHLDSDVAELGKNAKSAWPLLGDVDLTLQQLNQQLQTSNLEKATSATTAQLSEDKRPTFTADDSQPLTASVLGQALRASVPAGTIFVDESITAAANISKEFVDGNRQLTHVLAGRGGSLGYGIPAAIGVQLAEPGKPVLAVIGDGTALYSIQALWTMARYKLPVVTVICNNRNYDIITLEILRAKGGLAATGVKSIREYTGLTPPDLSFAALATGFGVQGQRITKPSELTVAIEAAFAAGQPALLEVMLSGPFSI